MEIRYATIHDAEPLALLHASIIRDVYGAIYSPPAIKAWSNGHTTDSWVARINGESIFLVAEDNGQIFGCGGLTGNRIGAYVHPSAHRRGIAKTLFELLEKLARENVVSEVELSAPQAAIPFYESVGCVVIGPKIQSFRNGSELTTFDMKKSLIR